MSSVYTYVLITRIICSGNDRICCGNEIISLGNEVIYCGNEIIYLGNEIICCGNEIVCCGNEIICLGNEIICCGSEIICHQNKIIKSIYLPSQLHFHVSRKEIKDLCHQIRISKLLFLPYIKGQGFELRNQQPWLFCSLTVDGSLVLVFPGMMVRWIARLLLTEIVLKTGVKNQ